MIPVNLPLLNGNEKKYLIECIDTGWVSSEGPFVRRFEEEMANAVGRRHGIAVCNGTAALETAVAALDLQPGDQVEAIIKGHLKTLTVVQNAVDLITGQGRALHEAANLKFVEVYVDCSLAEAERRDPKGLYKKARAGEIKNFTGIDDPYEAPEPPEIHLHTDRMTLEDEVQVILDYLLENDIIPMHFFTRASDAA